MTLICWPHTERRSFLPWKHLNSCHFSSSFTGSALSSLLHKISGLWKVTLVLQWLFVVPPLPFFRSKGSLTAADVGNEVSLEVYCNHWVMLCSFMLYKQVKSCIYRMHIHLNLGLGTSDLISELLKGSWLSCSRVAEAWACLFVGAWKNMVSPLLARQLASVGKSLAALIHKIRTWFQI